MHFIESNKRRTIASRSQSTRRLHFDKQIFFQRRYKSGSALQRLEQEIDQ